MVLGRVRPVSGDDGDAGARSPDAETSDRIGCEAMTNAAPLTEEQIAAASRSFAKMVADRAWPKKIVGVGDKLEGGTTYYEDGTTSNDCC